MLPMQCIIQAALKGCNMGPAGIMQVCRKHNCKAAKHPWSYILISTCYFPVQTWLFPSSGWMYPAGVPAGVGSTWKLPCSLGGHFAIWPGLQEHSVPFAGPCVPRSVTAITTPPPMECINYASIQTVPPAIPIWSSYLRTDHIAHQLCVCGGQSLSHHYFYVLCLYFALNVSYKPCKDSNKGPASIKSHKSIF